jgi:hypothetical protein
MLMSSVSYLYEGRLSLGKDSAAYNIHSRFQEAHCTHNHHKFELGQSKQNTVAGTKVWERNQTWKGPAAGNSICNVER